MSKVFCFELKSILSATDRTDEDAAWCLLESQDWVGSDIIRPDCLTDTTDSSCTDATNVNPEDERLANLYSDDVVSILHDTTCTRWS